MKNLNKSSSLFIAFAVMMLTLALLVPGCGGTATKAPVPPAEEVQAEVPIQPAAEETATTVPITATPVEATAVPAPAVQEEATAVPVPTAPPIEEVQPKPFQKNVWVNDTLEYPNGSKAETSFFLGTLEKPYTLDGTLLSYGIEIRAFDNPLDREQITFRIEVWYGSQKDLYHGTPRVIRVTLYGPGKVREDTFEGLHRDNPKATNKLAETEEGLKEAPEEDITDFLPRATAYVQYMVDQVRIAAGVPPRDDAD